MSKIVIPYYSGSGHTLRMAEAVLKGVKLITNNASLIDVNKMHDKCWQRLENADGIIFGSPTYMGSVAGKFKLFIDESSARGFWTKNKWTDKMAAGFTVGTYPSGDKLSTLIQMSIFAAQSGMIWVNNSCIGSKVLRDNKNSNQWGSWLGVMGTSIPDKKQLIGSDDLDTATKFGTRFARCVSRWVNANSA